MPTDNLDSVRILRGVGASCVAFHHACKSVTDGWPPQGIQTIATIVPVSIIDLAAIGVDLFFVISGFIMVYVSAQYRSGDKPVGDFLVRRVIRIYPMYWLMTGLLCALAIGGLFLKWRSGLPFELPFNLEPWTVLTSLLLIPSLNDVGFVAPILGAGWTLSCEMYFYLCFALVIWLGRGPILMPMFGIMALAIVIARAIGSDGAMAQFFRDTIVFEFIFGCGVGSLFIRSKLPAWNPTQLLIIAGVCLGLSMIWPPSTTYRFATWGIPCTLILIAFLRLEDFKPRWPAWGLLVGDASYSIYLTHGLVIARLLRVLTENWRVVAYADVIILLMFVASTVVGIVFFRCLEKPTQKFLLSLYRRRHTMVVA